MTIQTSWEYMQQYRKALSVAKWSKGVRSNHIKEIRQAGDYLRALRHWIKVASAHKKLRDRKACLTESLNFAHVLEYRASAVNCCEGQLVGDSCQSNIRAAMSWATTTLGANSFKDWDECVYNVEACIADALVQLDVAHSKFKALWKQAKSDMITARIVIGTCAKDILHPVALSKAEKYEIKRKHYALRGRVPVNTYYQVSASAMAEWAGMQSVPLHMPVADTKQRLTLVRTTRRNYLMRGAHQHNNKQDYLVRLPVYHNGTIDGRNWFVGSI